MVDISQTGTSLTAAAIASVFLFFSTKLLTPPQDHNAHGDNFRVIGPDHPILVNVGEDALLTCQLLPKKNAMNMEVTWYRSEPNTPMFAYRDGAEVTEMQMEEYRGRVQWIKDKIIEGHVALKMYKIQPSDDGKYWCRFQEGNYQGEASLQLQVLGVGSSPNVHMQGCVENDLQLLCTSKGWFPEPEVNWKSNTGEQLPTFSKHHLLDEDGLFYVESTLVVKNASLENVSCFIHSHELNEKSSTISISEKTQTELASLKVIGSSQPILVRVGEDIQLTCHLSPKTSAEDMEVRWVRSHYYPAIYVYVDGDHMSEKLMEEYRGRTALESDALNEGRVTLQIRSARISDAGQYWCLFEKDGVYQETSLDLKVAGLGTFPLITMERPKEGEILLTCTSEGWFPQPYVQWKDMEGHSLPSYSEELYEDSHGLFQVKTLLLKTDSDVNVTCSISNTLLDKEKMVYFYTSGQWLLSYVPVRFGK
ncbi:butyrophilin-like protein 2 [Erinaceus europaeus]|uniref:Butyrophilin-like protein 2 n=1 Tax=Erinaceus europaeus TaxID=9365 RepID=A0A1S3A0N3_ERIEU|nr:butyrophilin-like protein 2 [Erinaceus europaeus]